MPKLTPEAFSQLDEEEQLQLLKDIPADRLNDLHYYELNSEITSKEAGRILSELFNSIPEDAHFSLMTIMLDRLYHLTTESAERDGIEPPPHFIGMILLLTHCVAELKKAEERARGEDEES